MPCTHCAPPPTALFISCVVAVFTFQALSLTAAAYQLLAGKIPTSNS